MASMGPRHLSRGIDGASVTFTPGTASASMGPRHLSRGISVKPRRCYHAYRFNGATASEPWNRAKRGNAWSPPWCCFNGATASEPWNHPDRRTRRDVLQPASMGPRHLSRGIINEAYRELAAETLQWGHGI